MTWATVRTDAHTMHIADGCLPDMDSLESEASRYFPRDPGASPGAKSRDMATAWMLSALARRRGRYREKIPVVDLAQIYVETWVIRPTDKADGTLDDWFDQPERSDVTRIYMHANDRRYRDREISWNLFSYPHRQLNVARRRRPYKKLKEDIKPLLRTVGIALADGSNGVDEVIRRSGYAFVRSAGLPSNDRLYTEAHFC